MKEYYEMGDRIDLGDPNVIRLRQLTKPSKTVITARLLHPGAVNNEPVFLQYPSDSHSIYTTRWIGTIFLNDSNAAVNRIAVVPRIGWEGLKKILSTCLKISAPSPQKTLYSIEGTSEFKTILAVAWFYALRQALSHHKLIKDYKLRHEPAYPQLRGKFEVADHLRHNFVNKEKIACTFNELTYNIPINQSIIQVVDHLKKQKIWPFYKNNNKTAAIITNNRDLLNTLGVECPKRPVNPAEIRWDRRNHWFRAMVTLGYALLKDGGENSGHLPRQALFLDMAEIWEMFLFNILQDVAKEKRIVIQHPMSQQKKMDFLLEYKGKKLRGLIPDFLVHRNEKLIGVIDAKYKDLHDDWHQPGIPKKSDITQMFLYQEYYHNKRNGNPLPGALIFPQSQGLNQNCTLDKIVGQFCSYSEGRLGRSDKSPLSWWLWNIDIDAQGFKENMESTACQVLDWVLSCNQR